MRRLNVDGVARVDGGRVVDFGRLFKAVVGGEVREVVEVGSGVVEATITVLISSWMQQNQNGASVHTDWTRQDV